VSRNRRRRGRTIGLALAGGGPAGGIYEVGALCAIEEAVAGLTITDCDIFVGVSAGAFVASWLANGRGPRDLARALVSHGPDDLPFDPTVFFIPNYRGWLRRGVHLPRLFASALWALTRRPSARTAIERFSAFAHALPLGVFDNEPLRASLERAFALDGRTDDFRKLNRKLIIVAADLEAGESLLFGTPGWEHVPISRAVQASTALPGLYPPVDIDGRHCVDGVLLRTVHASAALESGADLLFCINPLVPADYASPHRDRDALIAGGLPAVLSQSLRTMIHSRMVVGMARYRTQFPDADVVLFEPERDDYDLAHANLGTVTEPEARAALAELAYQGTRADLRRRHGELTQVLARHGLTLRQDVLEDEKRTLLGAVGLEQGRPRGGITGRLVRALNRIEVRSSYSR